MIESDKAKLMQDREYELFVKDVLEKINAADGWENIQLQHNVTLTGKSGATHQIDIYWEFKCGILVHKVAVECKGYNSRITEEKIAAFQGVLADLNGVQGVYASQMGYQRGAIALANYNNIKLLEIRRPLSHDVKDRIWDINLRIVAHTIVNPQLRLKLEKAGISPEEAEPINGAHDPHEVMIIEDGQSKSLQDLMNSFRPINTDKHQCFDKKCDDTFIVMGEKKVRILEIRYEYDTTESTYDSVLSGDNVIKGLVKDLTEGKEQVVDWNGHVRDREKTEGSHSV